MNYDELNEYIKHYVEKDKTPSAIMLTGGWGTGKSYYIHNFLAPFLKEPQNGKHRCAIVSLYGLENASEISKRIYFELRSIGVSKKSEAVSTGKAAATIVAKTVLNGMTNMIGFDIGSIDDKNLEKVYSSIDLTNKLVIFEDLDRSNIDVIEILGYVNNLVEQDGAKVLLVANENEILKYCDSEPDESGKIHKVPNEKTEAYLKAKEKTISDTVNFKGDIRNAIENIISSFNNLTLNNFKLFEKINDIIKIMEFKNNYNLRSFIFACQKTVDIFEKIDYLHSLEDYMIKSIFYGTIHLSMEIKNGIIPDIPFNGLLCKTVEQANYMIYHFCYIFIRWQRLNMDEVSKTFSEHKRLKLYKKERFEDDNDLKIVFSYYLYSENAVRAALKNIESRLIMSNDIPLYSYVKLTYFLIKLDTVLETDFNIICQQMMIKNIKKEKNKIDPNDFDLSLSNYSFNSMEEENQFIIFSKEITRALNSTSSNKTYNFLYTTSDIKPLYDYVIDNKGLVLSRQKFLSDFDLPKLIEMIFKCGPLNLYDFRQMLLTVYAEARSDDFLIADITFMEDLKNELENSITSNHYLLKKIDRIQLFQINSLIKDLTRFIEQLS